MPFIFSCSSDTPENDKEKIPPIIDTSIRVGTFNVDVGQTATAEEIALSLKSFYLDILSLEECPILIDKNSGVEEFYSIIGKALGMEYFYIGDISSGNHWIEWGKDKTGKYAGKYKCKFLPERKHGYDLHRHTSSLLFFFRFRHTDGTDDQTGHPSRNENVVLYRTLRSLLSGHS